MTSAQEIERDAPTRIGGCAQALLVLGLLAIFFFVSFLLLLPAPQAPG